MDHRRLTSGEFKALIEPHLSRLYRIALRLTGSPSGAEDLVQELVTRLWERPGRLAEADSARAWLVRALYHLHIDLARREQRRPESAALELKEEILPDHLGISANGEQAWRTQRVLRLVMKLPTPQRMVIILHDLEGYSLEEAADMLGVRVGTAKSRLGRAHAKLRQRLTGNAIRRADVYKGEVEKDALPTI